MPSKLPPLPGFTVHPLTAERWDDFVQLFGETGACGGCWCMYWRVMRPEFERRKGSGNKRAMKKIVNGGEVPGLIAYVKNKPVGWCSVAPRTAFPRMARSKIMKPVDDQPAWSVVCLFVAREYRRQKLSVRLLKAAIAYAKKQKVKVLEGYPTDHKDRTIPDPFVYQGLASAFREAGFTEILRRSPSRPIMRYVIK
jgi:GNAT superfamily N-acetyltransferase